MQIENCKLKIAPPPAKQKADNSRRATPAGSGRRASPQRERASKRRGLATLELVLYLPILVAMMALMIGFGTMACWKIRGLCVARHAAWGSRWPRTGSSDPRPRYWPESAGVSAGSAGDVPELDDPRVNLPVIRGPLPYGTIVNEDLLDPARRLRRGTAHITRRFPLVTRLLAGISRYQRMSRTFLLDNLWQYARMGLWKWHNNWRRIPFIYELAKAPPELADAYVDAVVAILEAPFRPELRPLDRDDEFIGYASRFEWGSAAPDYHRRLRRFCGPDGDLASSRVEALIDQIMKRDEEGRVTGVPERMAKGFIGLYRRVIRQLQDLSAPDPPPPAVQAEIDQLQAKIDVLNQFLDALQNNDDN